MKNGNEYKSTNNRAFLLVGPPGSRKSSIALSFPRPYVADADNNIAGPIDWHRANTPDFKFWYDTIDVRPDGSERPEHERYSFMLDCLKEAIRSPEVQTLVVDSASKVNDYIAANILKMTGHATLQMQDWGFFLAKWKQLVVGLRASGKTVIFTAHEKPEKDEVSGIVKYFLNIPGQFGNIAGSMFSDVWRCEVEEKNGRYPTFVRTMPTIRHDLKSSLDLPAKFEWDPKAVFDKINSARSAK